MIVGLLGGIGSGKSTVARLLAERGAEVVDADRMAREVLESPAGRAALLERFGPETVREDGSIDRRRIAERVFTDTAALRELEAIVHPEVTRRVDERVERHREERTDDDLLVLDVPLLASSSLRRHCDALVFVDVPLEVRRERTGARGWSRGELERRESFQVDTESKRRLSNIVIDNAGPLEATRRRVGELVTELRELSRERIRSDVARGR